MQTFATNLSLNLKYSQANKWCARGVELLASQRIEKCSMSAEYAEQSLHEVQQFILSASDFCVSSPREFRNVFQDSTTPETKALVSQVIIIVFQYRIIIWTYFSMKSDGDDRVLFIILIICSILILDVTN